MICQIWNFHSQPLLASSMYYYSVLTGEKYTLFFIQCYKTFIKGQINNDDIYKHLFNTYSLNEYFMSTEDV